MFGVVSLLSVACSAAGGSAGDASAGAGDVAAVGLGFGAPCAQDADCEGGLCLTSDYAPFAFCSRTCTTPGDLCAEAGGAAARSYCVALPADLSAPGLPEPRPDVCLPLCGDLPACKALSVQWERCDPPSWKGQPLYGDAGGLRVCGAPSANGKPIVDAETCADWADGWRDKYAAQVSVCESLCELMDVCHLLEPGHSLDCCGLGCIGRMVDASGAVDVPYEKRQKCYVTSYFGHRGTAQVCKAPADDCGSPPEDPTGP